LTISSAVQVFQLEAIASFRGPTIMRDAVTIVGNGGAPQVAAC
jgi:hypothetical protein